MATLVAGSAEYIATPSAITAEVIDAEKRDLRGFKMPMDDLRGGVGDRTVGSNLNVIV